MGRGRAVYLSYTAVVLLSTASTTNAGLWTVDIDESPAPPPAKGPPFSAHASRNRALLPYQIIGIVGAYIGSVLIVGSLLLTVGRRLRKRAQEMATEPKEMVKPLSKTFERSPQSPGSSRPWYSPRRLKEKKSATSSIRSAASNQMSPGMYSVASFDNNVVEADKARRQVEMERLYAAVMAQDDRRTTSDQNVAVAVTTDHPPEYSSRKPPRLITDDPSLRYLQAGGPVAYPTTPKSPIRAIYPPDSPMPPGLSSPTSPIRAEYPPWARPTQPETRPIQPEVRPTHDRQPSYGSGQSGASSGGTKKFRKSIRSLKISGPIMRDDDNSDGARTPLSPRFYVDPGIPPEPPTAGTAHSMTFPPNTPGSHAGWDEDMDEVRDLPSANPQRMSAHNYASQAQMLTDVASTRRDPTRLEPIRTGAVGNGSLPLREMNRQYAQQASQQAAAFPLSPGHWNGLSPTHAYATSAGPVKTTFVDARRNKLGGPLTGLATPYSPYMPFTPLTPVTPRLTTKAERKQREKEERKARPAIVEEEAVADESELWSSGY